MSALPTLQTKTPRSPLRLNRRVCVGGERVVAPHVVQPRRRARARERRGNASALVTRAHWLKRASHSAARLDEHRLPDASSARHRDGLQQNEAMSATVVRIESSTSIIGGSAMDTTSFTVSGAPGVGLCRRFRGFTIARPQQLPKRLLTFNSRIPVPAATQSSVLSSSASSCSSVARVGTCAVAKEQRNTFRS